MLLKETLTKTLGSKEFIDACWRNLARDFLRDLTITKWHTRIEIEDDTNSFIETSKTAMESRSYLCFCTGHSFRERRWNKCPPFHLHHNLQRLLLLSRVQGCKTRQVSAPPERSCERVLPRQTHNGASQPYWFGEHDGIPRAVERKRREQQQNSFVTNRPFLSWLLPLCQKES